MPRVKIALAQRISERIIRLIMQIYSQFGWNNLKDHKTGCLETIVYQNTASYNEVIIY
jgi:hypothetical protein